MRWVPEATAGGILGRTTDHVQSAQVDRLAQQADQAAPEQAPRHANRGHGVLGLQRSAGNRATAALISQSPETAVQLQAAEGGGELMVQRSVGAWFRKKLGMKPKISGPTGGHAMTSSEQGGVPSARELMEIMEKGGKQNGAISDESVEGVGAMFDKAEGDNAKRDERKARQADNAAFQEQDSGVGDFMQQAEDAAAKAEQDEVDQDEALFTAIKKAAADLRDPAKTKADDQGALDAALVLVKNAIALWQQSPRRLKGLAGDRAKKQEIEALLQDLKWNVSKTKVDASALLPNPELKPGDKDGYFVAKTVDLFEVQPDGNLATSAVHYTNDATLDPLPPLTKGGKEGYGITIGTKTYWVLKTDVVIKHGKFDKVGGDLFAKDPSADDVTQTTLGDCYLQAAIASIASQNPGLIKSMIRDNGDDSVTVRLYKVDDTDSKNHKFDEQYFKVEKSVPKDSTGAAVYNTGAIWVRMIEKAYAAGGFTGRTNKAAPATLSYEGIAGGQSRHALEVLTGKPSSAIMVNEGPVGLGTDNYWKRETSSDIQGSTVKTDYTQVNVPWDANEVSNHATAKAADNYDSLLSFKILKDKGKVDTWITYVKTDKIKDMFTARDTDRNAGFAVQITLADFDAAFKNGLDAGIATTMLAWLEAQKLYPGALGTAKYSSNQLEMFAQIKKALDAGGEVTAATQDKPTKGATGVGASGGEAVALGMVGGHVYTILTYRASAPQDPTDLTKAGDFYWLKIRNPWGNYGRKYDFSKAGDAAGEEVKDGDGVSWLELSDLTKFFNQIHFN